SFHLAVWSIVAGHYLQRQIRVWLAVCHHTTGSDHTFEAGGIDNVAGWEVAEVVSGSSNNEHSEFVKCVDGIGPSLRRKATHTHCDYMNRSISIRDQFMNIVECLSNRTVFE